MRQMETLKATLVMIAFGAGVILLCVWAILALRRSKRSLRGGASQGARAGGRLIFRDIAANPAGAMQSAIARPPCC